jgi:hypothetical protein
MSEALFSYGKFGCLAAAVLDESQWNYEVNDISHTCVPTLNIFSPGRRTTIGV